MFIVIEDKEWAILQLGANQGLSTMTVVRGRTGNVTMSCCKNCNMLDSPGKLYAPGQLPQSTVQNCFYTAFSMLSTKHFGFST